MTTQQTSVLITVLVILVQTGIFASLAALAKRAIDRALGPKRARMAYDFAVRAVQASEQLAKANNWDGPAKLDAALKQARDLADAHGIALDDSQWRTLIEAAVKAGKDFNSSFLVGTVEQTAPPVPEPVPIVAPVVLAAPPTP